MFLSVFVFWHNFLTGLQFPIFSLNNLGTFIKKLVYHKYKSNILLKYVFITMKQKTDFS